MISHHVIPTGSTGLHVSSPAIWKLCISISNLIPVQLAPDAKGEMECQNLIFLMLLQEAAMEKRNCRQEHCRSS